MKKHQKVFDPLGDPKDGHILTRAIIDTIREPLIVLDGDLRIITASRSFYKKFNLTHRNTHDKLFYEIAENSWDIPALRSLLEKIIPKRIAMEAYEVTHNFPFLGLRTMLVNAREIKYENGKKKMLLSIFDITLERSLKSEKEKLMSQKDLLLREMRHRIANSLQLIASILTLKAGMVKSEESRFHLEDAHNRIMTVATIQEQLDPTALDGEKIKIGPYLTGLCNSLSRSMIGGRKPITLSVDATQDIGTRTSEEAISFGLITTELVINSLKHGFPGKKGGKVLVTYVSKKMPKWSLTVSDNGAGYPMKIKNDQPGLGTGIVAALANQLGAKITTKSTKDGTKVSIIYNHELSRKKNLSNRR
jgi:two-component sensor histidine kinase